jgi:hypothetical protein
MYTRVRSLLNDIHKDPSLLLIEYPDMRDKLHKQGNMKAQGTGNTPTYQEAAFARELEKAGFTFIPKGANMLALSPGNYFSYQLNGSQRDVDFQVTEVIGSGELRHLKFDLKHTTSDVFFLNDGWFKDDIIYIISWKRPISAPRKRKVTVAAIFIAWGEDIPTHEETATYFELVEEKKRMNSMSKGCGSLRPYVRFANTYDCDGFGVEETAAALWNVCASLDV